VGIQFKEYLPEEDVTGDNEGNVSLDDEGDVDLGSVDEGVSNTGEDKERNRVPNEGKGSFKSRTVVGDGIVTRVYLKVAVVVGPDPILHGRVRILWLTLLVSWDPYIRLPLRGRC